MPTVTIDGRTTEAVAGQTILQAAQKLDLTIPTLCHHSDLSPVGDCRLCMVEVEGIDRQLPACRWPVRDGMVVRTVTPALERSRKLVLQFMLRVYVDHAEPLPDTEFMRWIAHYGVQVDAADHCGRHHPLDGDPHPLIAVDLNKCILCTRCIRACNEVQGRFVWHLAGCGTETKIVAGIGATMRDAGCESCGACAAYCPTGAIIDRAAIGQAPPDKLVTTTCSFCGVGCQFDLNVRDGKVLRVTSNQNAPVNGLALCVKGRYGHDYIHHPDRLTTPQVRKYLLDEHPSRRRGEPRDAWVAVDWQTALDVVVRKFDTIRNESGCDAMGVLSSAKCTNEENYLMQKLARQVLGTHNVDHCARLCHASTVAGLSMCYGSGAMSNSMDDVVQHAEAMFLIGSNVTEQHPVFGTHIRQAVMRRGMKLVVADPRRIDIAEFALVHLQQRPGTDVALINGLMHVILENGWQDTQYIDTRCDAFDDLCATVCNYPPELVAQITGVPADELRRAAEILGTHRPMAVVWAMGITQHTTGVMNVLSLGNLQMLLGNIGVPGGGVNPLRGQNNVQGACDMGALPNVFPGYQPVTDPDVRARFQDAWALSPMLQEREAAGFEMSKRAGLTVMEMMDAANKGALRGLYILGEDPAMTEPDSNHARACLEACEFTVLQEIFPSETSAYADVLLPGASFAEKSGTFTNTERRIQLVRQAIDPPGKAWQDWQITAEIARRMLALQNFQPYGPQAAWQYRDTSQIMDELAALTPLYGGVTYARLEQGQRLQWPVPHANHPGTPILHVDRFSRGKGKFHAVDYLPAVELPDTDFSLILTTGRVLYHWHGGELTRRVSGLMEICPQSLIEVSPEDAQRLGIADGSAVRVTSRRGEMLATAIVTSRVAPGVVFGNFHFPGPQNVNNLTIAALDPVAKIPEYKVCAVAVVPCAGG